MDQAQAEVVDSLAHRDALLRPFVLKLAAVVTLLALLPYLFAVGIQPNGTLYLGTPFNSDDHMVYAAWMRQAQEGRFLFDNRFTVDPQPGLTVNVYFWLLGLISRATGIVAASNLSRAVFTFSFVLLLWQVVRRSRLDVFSSKFAMVLGVFSGGLGFLVWHNFGRLLVRPLTQPFGFLFGQYLPIDVWQPEAFVFSSMLTNGLFMVSLCLMLVVILAVLDARSSWRPVLWGIPAMGVLMNIHSYDVLLLGFVFAGLLVACIRQGLFEWAWFLRVLTICSGMVPGALWFVHVLQSDPVFQSRAATPTFTTGVPTILGGLAPGIVLVTIAFWTSPDSGAKRRWATMAWVMVLATCGFAAYRTGDHYAFPMIGWIGLFVFSLAICVLLSRKDIVWNLLTAWVVLGIIAPYAPALFQRKLAAGLVIPFAVLGCVGLSTLMRRFERQQRNLVAGFFIVLLCASSVLWFRREFELIRDNVSTTTVQPAFLSKDGVRIVEILNQDLRPRRVLVAVPGVPNPTTEPDRFGYPLVPDLNPIVTGLAGVYTYAGHWSETPQYADRRNESMKELFLASSSQSQRKAFLDRIEANYVISINPETYPGSPFADLRNLGEIQYAGNQFILVRIR